MMKMPSGLAEDRTNQDESARLVCWCAICDSVARMRAMIFDIYGRFLIEVQKTDSGWAAYRKSSGLRAPYPDLVFPADLKESELEQFLDDHFHEYAQPGQVIGRVMK